MPALTCPYCGAYANFTQRAVLIDWQVWLSSGRERQPVDVVALTCNACMYPVVGGMTHDLQGGPPTLLWHEPQKVVSVEFPDVPEHIASDASEAFRCSGVSAWRATVAIARRSVQAAAIEQGAPDKKLQHQIEWLDEERKITPQMREMAEEIRLSGNDGAHPDKDGLKDVDREQAEAVLIFLEDFLRHLYQVPARLERARAKVVDASPFEGEPQGRDEGRWPPLSGP